MPRYKREFNQKIYEKWVADGRGKGQGADYNRWLNMQDVATIGNATRLRSRWTHGREVHLFSNLERDWFYIFDWSPDIIDIREQYPLLPLEKTVAIANDLNIKHPRNSKSKFPNVMTIDFVLTRRAPNGHITYEARTVKPSDRLSNEVAMTLTPKEQKSRERRVKRVLEKFQIERTFIETQPGWDYKIVTEVGLNKTLTKNIEIMRDYVTIVDRISLSDSMTTKIAIHLTEEFTSQHVYLIDVTKESDRHFKLQTGTSLIIAYFLLANRFWEVDKAQSINPHRLYQLSTHDLSRLPR